MTVRFIESGVARLRAAGFSREKADACRLLIMKELPGQEAFRDRFFALGGSLQDWWEVERDFEYGLVAGQCFAQGVYFLEMYEGEDTPAEEVSDSVGRRLKQLGWQVVGGRWRFEGPKP